MEEQLISFKTAKLAKEKGFYFLTLWSYWMDNKKLIITDMTPDYQFPEEVEKYKKWERYMAPTQSLLQKWLREECEIFVAVRIPENGTYKYQSSVLSGPSWYNSDYYNTYEEALEAGLKEALKLIKI